MFLHVFCNWISFCNWIFWSLGFFFFFGKFWELFTYFRYYPFVNYVALNISSRPKLFIESFGEQNFLILSKSKSTFLKINYSLMLSVRLFCLDLNAKDFFCTFHKKFRVLITFTFYTFTVYICEYDSFWAVFFHKGWNFLYYYIF